MKTGLAYLNYGIWVVDCPEDECTDARAVYDPGTGRRQTEDRCARGHHFRIDMPPPALEAQIVAAVADRAADKDKGWYPAQHARALLTGQRTGQSVADLVRENDEVAAHRASEKASKQQQLRDVLDNMGLEFDTTTGLVKGF